jgi:hypothetical protein
MKATLRQAALAVPCESSDFIIPDGYMTGDEFERRVKARVTQFYKENGLI